MKLSKQIHLQQYSVEIYDTRQSKPRAPLEDRIVIDGGRVSALHRLDQSVNGYISELYGALGYAVGKIRKVREYTVTIDLTDLWTEQVKPEEKPNFPNKDKEQPVPNVSAPKAVKKKS